MLPRYGTVVENENFFLEWYLVDSRYVFYRSRMVLMLAGWTAESPNAAVIVLDGVGSSQFEGLSTRRSVHAWIIGGANIEHVNGDIEVTIGVVNDSTSNLQVRCARAEIRLGYSADFAGAPPDFSEHTLETVMMAMPDWHTPFTPLYADAFVSTGRAWSAP